MTTKFFEDNKYAIYKYLDDKMTDHMTFLIDLGSEEYEKGAEEYQEIRLSACDTVTEVVAWCEKYLSKKQNTALKAAIRKKNSRQKQQLAKYEIDSVLTFQLKRLSKLHGLTQKACLEKIIEDSYKANFSAIMEQGLDDD